MVWYCYCFKNISREFPWCFWWCHWLLMQNLYLYTFVLPYFCNCIFLYLHTSILAYLHTCIYAYFYTFILGYQHTFINLYTCILACTCIRAYLHSCILAYFLRGGVTKKNGKRGQGYCNQSLKINTIIPAITSLSGNMIQ